MPVFRKDLTIWEKVIRMILLVMLGIVGVCIAMLEYLKLPATTKDLLETIVVRAFVLWWVGVVVLALYTVLRYRRPESRPTYYTHEHWNSYSGGCLFSGRLYQVSGDSLHRRLDLTVSLVLRHVQIPQVPVKFQP